MICKLCGADDPGCRAHIIPESFYRYMRADQEVLVTVPTNRDKRVGRTTIGCYDSELVCRGCENRFHAWDTCAAEFLIQRTSGDGTPISNPRNGRIHAYRYDAFDYVRLKMFFISVLWRAAATSHHFFQSVDVGPHIHALRDAVLSGDPGGPQDFATVLTRWHHELEVCPPIPCPIRQKMRDDTGNLNSMRFYFGTVVADIKIDRRPCTGVWERMVMRPDSPLYFLSRDFESSKDIAVLIPALERHSATVERIAGQRQN